MGVFPSPGLLQNEGGRRGDSGGPKSNVFFTDIPLTLFIPEYFFGYSRDAFE
jgi:hypothetical protein